MSSQETKSKAMKILAKLKKCRSQRDASYRDIQGRKEALAEDIKTMVRRIANSEELYFESSHFGHILKGWDILTTATDVRIPAQRRLKVTDRDRIFSYSVASTAALRRESEGGDGDSTIDDNESVHSIRSTSSRRRRRPTDEWTPNH